MNSTYYSSETISTNIFSKSTWPSVAHDYQINDGDGFIDADDEPFSLVTKVVAYAWLLLLIFVLIRRWKLRRQRMEREEQREARRVARREARREARERLEQRLDPRRRDKDVEAAIMTVSYTEHDDQRCQKEDTNLPNLDGNIFKFATEEERTCSICLDQFAVGSELSWSRDLYCRHVFHKECLTPWLMKHDDCPVCRTDLIIDHDVVKIKSGDDTDDSSADGENLDDDVEPSRLGTFQIVNGLVSYVRQTSLSMLHHRSEGEEEQTPLATIDETIPQVGTRTASDEEHGGRS